MLILIPFILIVLVILLVDAVYFGDVEIREEQKPPIVKEDNKTGSMQEYFEKYIEK